MSTSNFWIQLDIRERDLADALKEFKKQLKKSGLLQELRIRESYMSPSKKKRFKHNEAIKQRKRDERKAQWQSKKPTE